MNSADPPRSPFPSLPILPPDVVRRSERERYGGLFYLGIAGLAIVVALVGWFAFRVWTMRDIWADVYRLHDVREPEEARIQAAYRLSRDPRIEPAQKWEMALRRGLPELARYVLAEGVTESLVAADPRGYVAAVARSPDWPEWLRLVLAGPLAYAAAEGHSLSRERLSELCRRDDPYLRLWALAALALQPRPDPQTIVEIERVACSEVPESHLAAWLLEAIQQPDPGRRRAALDSAAAWQRHHHPNAATIWKGWDEQAGKLTPKHTEPP